MKGWDSYVYRRKRMHGVPLKPCNIAHSMVLLKIILSYMYYNRKTGSIIFAEEKIGLVQRYAKSMEDNLVPHQVMPAREANEKYSDQLQLPEDYLCLTEEDGGILRASKAVATLQVS